MIKFEKQKCKRVKPEVYTERWTWLVLRENAIYHSLNQSKADVSGMLHGEDWAIAECIDDMRDVVNKVHSNMDMAMP